MTLLQVLGLVLISIFSALHIYRPIRLVHVGGVVSTIYWTVLSWLSNYPVTPGYTMWDEGDIAEDYEKWKIQRQRVIGIWEFLKPFFSSHGYDLYDVRNRESGGTLYPQNNGVLPNKEARYPYAKSMLLDEKEAGFSFVSPSAWAARDRDGHDLIIKVVSGFRNVRTYEVQASRLLSSKPLRDDPRNPSIPILELLEFNRQVFAVMPRWSLARIGEFTKLGEAIRYGRAFLEGVAFLHENKMTHGDIISENMVKDVIVPPNHVVLLAGVYGPERKYAFIDFEGSLLPSTDGEISPLFEQHTKSDLKFLAITLEVNLRCLESIAPKVVDLLEIMKTENPPSATKCLSMYDEAIRHLTTEDLDLHIESTMWRGGRFITRKGQPVYREVPSKTL